jgi:hypothetical protein
LKLKSVYLLLGAALNLTLLGCATGKLPPPKIERGAVYSIGFPAPWTTRDTDQHSSVITLPFVYEVRKTESAPWNELLFALKGSGEPISIEHYAVRLGREVDVTLAPTGAWERAVPIPGSNSYFGDTQTHLFPASPEDRARQFELEGKAFVTTGEMLSKVVLSPNKTFVAALSYTSPEKPSQGHIIFGGGGPTRGQFFWDIYSTTSSEKVASGSFTFTDMSPGVIAETAQWVAEKYLILPQDDTAQRCLLIAATDKGYEY